MDKTTRYLILLFIFIIFLALAPLIVLYVSGKGLSFNDNPAGTGILDVQTNPSGAKVYLDGKTFDNSPTTIRFIKQGTYDIEIKKDGYHSWRKRLFIEAGKVTYAGTLDDTIKLLPNKVATQLTDQEVKTSITIGSEILFINTDKVINIYDLEQNKITKTAQASVAISELIPTKNNQLVIAKTEDNKLMTLDTKNLTLTTLPQALNGSENIEMVSTNTLLAQKGNSLISYDLKTQSSPKTILNNIRAFTINGDLIYTANSTQNSLETYLWSNDTASKQNILYSAAIPDGQVTKLYITDHKELFLKIDRSLYRINNKPELISNQVELINFNTERQQLTFKTPTEIYFYNFSSSTAELFNRQTTTTTQALVIPELGYGFIANDNGLSAIEIDNRNGQNQYLLFNTNPVAVMTVSADEKQLVILADRRLYSIIIN